MTEYINIAEVIGHLAGSLTTAAFLPQAIKVFKTKRTQDISLLMYIILCLGVGCWFAYGVMINALPVMIANGLTLVLAASILVFKLVSEKEK
ncbi:SemiSWEET transporter [Candidatus Nucleicultrix amoebiphila]|jgi:MtN3 and saliva related transmembrane protein|uniref:Glutathione synthetase n=1 Tax=Candidatus Nucleicultrix amoebiphila FS5 TaxID=1414854 RepID=A0A1W6N3N2_9PROT|nr:SemiSWEET transporter [Candidatus Nucleicultrix amoebiphila]ARN84389.1 hypothetical protein GQ61_02560 [Candidatus Nucleicultrix amoebiphila FS5]